MPALRSRTVTHGRNMAGTRALLRGLIAVAHTGDIALIAHPDK
jgi:hypothetical protein